MVEEIAMLALKIRRLLFSAIVLSSCLLRAHTIPVVLNFQEGSQTEVSLSFSTGGRDSAVSTFTGTAEAWLTFSDDFSSVTEIRFIGGRSERSDIDLSISSNVYYNEGGGNRQTDFEYRTRSLAATYSSTETGAISPTGIIDNEFHSIVQNEGTIVESISVPSIGFSDSETQNLVSAPITSVFLWNIDPHNRNPW